MKRVGVWSAWATGATPEDPSTDVARAGAWGYVPDRIERRERYPEARDGEDRGCLLSFSVRSDLSPSAGSPVRSRRAWSFRKIVRGMKMHDEEPGNIPEGVDTPMANLPDTYPQLHPLFMP